MRPSRFPNLEERPLLTALDFQGQLRARDADARCRVCQRLSLFEQPPIARIEENVAIFLSSILQWPQVSRLDENTGCGVPCALWQNECLSAYQRQRSQPATSSRRSSDQCEGSAIKHDHKTPKSREQPTSADTRLGSKRHI